MFIHAQRDLNTKVGHDERLIVANDRTVTSGRDQLSSTARDETISTGRDRRDHVQQDSFTRIDRNALRDIGNVSKETVGADHHFSVGRDQTLIVEGTRTIEARTAERLLTPSYMLQGTERIHIRGPSGKITFDADGITIEAPSIRFKGTVTYQTPVQAQLDALQAAIREGGALVEECPLARKPTP